MLIKRLENKFIEGATLLHLFQRFDAIHFLTRDCHSRV